jgi:3-oxoacyl-[acyl-carrier protein] reductase
MKYRFGRIGSTEDIAKAALFLASDDSDYITGQVISPNGGWVI